MANPNSHAFDPDDGYFDGPHTEYVVVSTYDSKEGLKHEVTFITERPGGEA